MLKTWLTTVVAVIATVTMTSYSQPLDRTLETTANGRGIVDAVVDRLAASCIFPHDKLFMRRLAVVESDDGYSKSTFRDNYFGGIWQVRSFSCSNRLIIAVVSPRRDCHEGILDSGV
jgi:hypothetical protein